MLIGRRKVGRGLGRLVVVAPVRRSPVTQSLRCINDDRHAPVHPETRLGRTHTQAGDICLILSIGPVRYVQPLLHILLPYCDDNIWMRRNVSCSKRWQCPPIHLQLSTGARA